MTLKLLLFGITKDIIGGPSYQVELTDNFSVKDLKNHLQNKFPELKKLNSLLIAINDEYANDENTILASDEIALIPPVSGG